MAQGSNAEHDEVVVANLNDTFEFIFAENGTDTSSKSYYGMPDNVKAIHLVGDKVWQLLEINNKPLKAPKTFAANTAFQENVGAYQYLKFRQVKVKALNATTTFSCYASA